jgi:uncharacterized membrane protein YraQ (UPF0718 family)
MKEMLSGYLAAGMIAFFLKPEQVRKHLGGSGTIAVLKAVLIGIPLPVCSCGVIPIATALRKEGAGKGATGAFFISTPQIGVDSAIVTANMLGWSAALIRALTAFLSGVTGGILISRFAPSTEVFAAEKNKKSCCCCCHSQKSQKEKKHWSSILSYGFLRMMKSTAPSLLTGIAVAALIQQIVPENFGAEYLCGNVFLEFAVVLIFSIPLYVCSSASVPVALVLILKGFSPGAALLFLIAGPTIHSVSITSMRQIIGTKAMLLATASIAFWAVAAGCTVNLFNIPINTAAGYLTSSGHSAELIKTVCGILLALLVLRALIARYLEKHQKTK